MTRVPRRELLTTITAVLGTGCLNRPSGDSTTVQQTTSTESTTTRVAPTDRLTNETAPPTATHKSATRTKSSSESETETPPPAAPGESPTQTIERCGRLYYASVPVTITTSEVFELSTATEVVPYSRQLTVTLKNITQTDQLSGIKGKIDIQQKETGSWKSVLYTDEYPVWSDIPVRHPPGKGFEWNINIGPGLDFADRIDPSFQACEAVEPGVYRFVYWGITRQPQRTNYALSVQFRLEER